MCEKFCHYKTRYWCHFWSDNNLSLFVWIANPKFNLILDWICIFILMFRSFNFSPVSVTCTLDNFLICTSMPLDLFLPKYENSFWMKLKTEDHKWISEKVRQTEWYFASNILKEVYLTITRSFLRAAGDISSYHTIPIIRESFNFHSKLDTYLKPIEEVKLLYCQKYLRETVISIETYQAGKHASFEWPNSSSQYSPNEQERQSSYCQIKWTKKSEMKKYCREFFVSTLQIAFDIL